MNTALRLFCAVVLSGFCAQAHAGAITVQYTLDAGGRNRNPLNGLAALATFTSSGNGLSVLVQNTSTGVPARFNAASSLITSLGMSLPNGTRIVSGDSATIGSGSIGLQAWASRERGGSVADEWGWTNRRGNQAFAEFEQTITTTRNVAGMTLFGGGRGRVGDAFGGIAAGPPILSIPRAKKAVSSSILFELTLSSALTREQLSEVAYGSMIEFGADAKYLRPVPEPSSLMLLAAAGAARLGMRQRSR